MSCMPFDHGHIARHHRSKGPLMTTPGDLRHHLSQSQAWVASLVEEFRNGVLGKPSRSALELLVKVVESPFKLGR